MNEDRGQTETVYIVDNDPAVCSALSGFLASHGYTIREFTSAEDFLGTITNAAEGVLVLDYHLGGMSGLELQTELAARGNKWPIIFISGRGDVPASVKAMKQGAVNFLEKPFHNRELLENLTEAFLHAEQNRQERTVRRAIDKRCERLTPREKEIMEYLVSGVSNKKLAARLGVSNRTVEVHRSRIMAKMNADSLVSLVRMAGWCRKCSQCGTRT
jgi:RNA polymerase sigma factor (sigma-70 family)